MIIKMNYNIHPRMETFLNGLFFPKINPSSLCTASARFKYSPSPTPACIFEELGVRYSPFPFTGSTSIQCPLLNRYKPSPLFPNT